MCAACVMRVPRPSDVYLIRSFCLFLSIENLKISNLKSDCVAKTIQQSPWSIWKITRAFSSCLQNNPVVYSLLPTAVVAVCHSADLATAVIVVVAHCRSGANCWTHVIIIINWPFEVT